MVTLGFFWHMRVPLDHFWDDFGVSLGRWKSNGRYDALGCGFDGVIVRSKRAHKQEYKFPRRILLVQHGLENARPANSSAKRGIWGSL